MSNRMILFMRRRKAMIVIHVTGNRIKTHFIWCMAAQMETLKLQQKNDFKEVHTKLQTSTVTYFFTQYSELVKRASWGWWHQN